MQAGIDVRPNWLDAAKDLELADAVERSAKKGRTIDLHFEEHTEHGTFKGIMACWRWALSIAALVVLVVATTLGNLFGRGRNFPLADWWPYLLVAVCAFLAAAVAEAGVPRRRLETLTAILPTEHKGLQMSTKGVESREQEILRFFG